MKLHKVKLAKVHLPEYSPALARSSSNEQLPRVEKTDLNKKLPVGAACGSNEHLFSLSLAQMILAYLWPDPRTDHPLHHCILLCLTINTMNNRTSHD